MPAITTIAIQSSYIQTKLVKLFTNTISETLNTKVSISKVDFAFFNELILDNVFIADQNGDTLFYTNKLSADITYLSYNNKKINISTITLYKPAIYIRKNTEGLNIQFLIDYFKKSNSSWIVSLKDIIANNGVSTYQVENHIKKDYGINYQDVFLKDLNFRINNMDFGDTTKFEIASLNFKEKSGAVLKHFNASTNVTKGLIDFTKMELNLSESEIFADHLSLRFNESKDFLDYYHKLKINALITRSRLSFTDIAYLNSTVRGLNETILISGRFKGKLSDLRAKDIIISYKDDTKLLGSFSLIGLPNFRETFIYTDITKFTTSKYDIESIDLPQRWLTNSINLPEWLTKIGHIEYSGNLTGFLNDYVAYGKLESDFGIITTDLGVKKHKGKDYVFHGDIHTEQLNLKHITNYESLINEVNLTLKINGSYNHSGLLAKIEGVVDSIDFNNYIYHNIDIDGTLTNKKFDGLVNIFDPNLELEFSGRFDFSTAIPEFNFNSVVTNARLDKLNLYMKDSLPLLSFTMQSNFIGSDPDNLKGEVILWDTEYKTFDNSIYMEEFYLIANQEDSINSLYINSSLADISIDGHYKFSTLRNSINNYIYNQFPSFSSRTEQFISDDNLKFKIQLKEVSPLFKSFFPAVNILPNTNIDGVFSGISNSLDINISLPGFTINNLFIDSLDVKVKTQYDLLSVSARSNDITFQGISLFPNFNLTASSFIDSLNFYANWNNNDSIVDKGEIVSMVSFKKSKSKYPEISIFLKPTEITISDSIWSLSSCKIINDSSFMSFDNFNFKTEFQHIMLNGEISHNIEDTLTIRVKDIPLANFNNITKINKYFKFNGIINGESSITNIYNEGIFSSNLNIKDLFVNGEKIGDAKVTSSWDNTNKQLNINTVTSRGEINPINLTGYYIPSTKKIDFNILLNKFHIAVFHSFLDNYISDLNGIISDTLALTGTLKKPVLDGRLKVQKASFLFDYLNTQYFFSDFISINDNIIQIEDIDIFDTRGGKAKVNGTIINDYFKNLFFDIQINTEDFTFLNTKESNNSLYFGDAFATGIIDINGDLKNIEININARTEKNTRFFIPLYTESEITDNNFISFINNKNEELVETIIEEEIDLSGIQLNFELEVTPDAEVQMIFNSKLGDIIKGFGNANLKMEINTQGQFNMYGEYLIEKGEYLFVLANLMSKKFKVKQGGTVIWDGDPYNANIDIETYYSLKTSLKELYNNNDTSEAYTKTIPVECQIFMKDKLMSPEFNFAIDLPKSGETEKAQLNSLPEDELNKQFISLLFINRFQPLVGLNIQGNAATSTYSLTESTSELLSNQLSHWLSQISNDFDLGFKYRPGDEVSTSQVEVALETQLFNDRLRINGNVGVGGQYSNTNSIVGDFEADLKLNKSGKVRIKAYTKSNNNFDYDKGPTTQGLGLFYREEFDSFSELLNKYFRKSLHRIPVKEY